MDSGGLKLRWFLPAAFLVGYNSRTDLSRTIYKTAVFCRRLVSCPPYLFDYNLLNFSTFFGLFDQDLAQKQRLAA